MKKYVLFVGVLGVFSLFAACTVKDKGLDPLDDDGEATVLRFLGWKILYRKSQIQQQHKGLQFQRQGQFQS